MNAYSETLPKDLTKCHFIILIFFEIIFFFVAPVSSITLDALKAACKHHKAEEKEKDSHWLYPLLFRDLYWSRCHSVVVGQGDAHRGWSPDVVLHPLWCFLTLPPQSLPALDWVPIVVEKVELDWFYLWW